MSTSAPSSSGFIKPENLKEKHSYQLANSLRIRSASSEAQKTLLARPQVLLEKFYSKSTNSYELRFQTDYEGKRINMLIWVWPDQNFLEPSSAPAPIKGGKCKTRRNKRKSRKNKRKSRKH